MELTTDTENRLEGVEKAEILGWDPEKLYISQNIPQLSKFPEVSKLVLQKYLEI